MEISGKAVISHFTFSAPLIASSDMQNEACFIIPLNAFGDVFRYNGKASITEKQGILMKCGTYINKWEAIKKASPAEVIIFRLFPDLLTSILDSSSIKIGESENARTASAVVLEVDELLEKFVDSLFFYFDHPQLVTEELVLLKIKELTLLLINSRNSNVVTDLISRLFVKDNWSPLEIVQANIFESISISELATLANMSDSTFKRRFKKLTGESPGKYIQQKRLEKSKNLLLSSNLTVAEIAYDVGFSDPNYFSKVFNTLTGLSPTSFREGNKKV